MVVPTMRIKIYNLHNMCENNTLFLSRARKYFEQNDEGWNPGRAGGRI